MITCDGCEKARKFKYEACPENDCPEPKSHSTNIHGLFKQRKGDAFDKLWDKSLCRL